MYAREQLEESTVLHGKVLEPRSDVLVRSQGAAKDTQTTVLWGQGWVTNPSGGPLGRGWEMGRANTSRIPHTRFASMKPNVQGREQMVFEARQHGSGAGRGSGNIDVVEKSPHVLSGVELLLEGAERGRKCKREQGGHERVALLATFALGHEVGDAFIVCPHKRRRRAIEQADKGEHGGGLRRVSELGEHGLAAYEVKCTNAINGKDSAAGVSIGLELEAVGESLSPCTRGQGELVGAGGFINVAAAMLGKCAGNQTAEEVPDNKSTDASGWFAQCNEASEAEC